MQGDPDIIELLNEVLTAELTAINQYFLDAKMLDNWGIERLAHHFRDASIDEMKDAERITDRILYLDGMPNYQRLGAVKIGETAMEKLRLALDLEKEAIERYNRGVDLARSKGDNGTREMLAEPPRRRGGARRLAGVPARRRRSRRRGQLPRPAPPRGRLTLVQARADSNRGGRPSTSDDGGRSAPARPSPPTWR